MKNGFVSESLMQKHIHENPADLQNGIPELDPDLNESVPRLISLGREIPLLSGPLDNLFIDINGVLTIVECKRYSDSRIKREVYSQVINYTTDLQNMLLDIENKNVFENFKNIISKVSDIEILEELKKDTILSGKNIDHWETEFKKAFARNIRSAYFRVIILCSPTDSIDLSGKQVKSFSGNQIRNLMDIMSFSENKYNNYELILMDMRSRSSSSTIIDSKIIWRRYSKLPMIPLVGNSIRDNASKIERNLAFIPSYSKPHQDTLEKLLANLKGKYRLKENSQGYSINKENKSLYTEISLNEKEWQIRSHQISDNEPIFILLNEINSKAYDSILVSVDRINGPNAVINITLRDNVDSLDETLVLLSYIFENRTR
ncbi:hypothetical protein A9Q84_14675 [Halobacteriovorax marinus]|uniref:Uncharacterized protein n=1 Tax=Halobacteriovorax marinus TaxID=97084 RepID=A0A1Y5FAG1_9BACT|nr:hypothetical protein A9Q84_14675 [Halobacteriovorax marinus]